MSQKEKLVKKQIETQAAKQQQKKTKEIAAAASKSNPTTVTMAITGIFIS